MKVEPPRLDPATERIANHLLRHLEWQDQGFSLVFLFADVGPGLSLASWLDQRLVEIGARLERHEVTDDFVAQPQKLVDEIVDQRISKEGSNGPLWLWLPRHPVDEQWNSARRVFLARLNERRFLLERDLGRPLILVLPSAFKSDARAIAPDLWTIRALSEELRAPRLPGVAAVGRSALPAATASGVGWVGSSSSLDASLRFSAYDDWRRAYATAPDRAFLATAADAVSELMQVGRLADAMVVAEQALQIAEERAARYPDNLAPLYDLTWSLNTAAVVASAQGNWSEAKSLSQKSLATSGKILKRLGSTREALHHFSMSLASVAGVASAQGNWNEAEGLYRESLAISRQLLERFGATRQSLHDLSRSLANLARAVSAQDNWNEAESLYRESLAISRQLLERFGGTALRDLSISLDCVAGVVSAQGNWAEAESLYRESLAIRRQLLELRGSTPETMSDVYMSLYAIALAVSAQGNWVEAERLCRESLALSYRLLESLGGTPEAMRDVSISLVQVAGVTSAQGNWAEAESLYREALAIKRRLLERLGDTQEALEDVGITLYKLGTLQGKRDETLLKEALQIYERLVTRYPSIVDYQTRLQMIREALEGGE